jgi:DNA-directed RNA polymerase subunit RPC12/RpoP
MYITYDYKCVTCNTQETRFIRKEEKDNQKCNKCNQVMLRLPASPSFKI